MVGKALAQTAQARDHNNIVEKWMNEAVNMYKDEMAKVGTEKKLGLKKVCKVMTERCWAENHVHIQLDKETLQR
jgi:hypothetical protein